MAMIPYTRNPGERRLKTECGRYVIMPPNKRSRGRWRIVKGHNLSYDVASAASVRLAIARVEKMLDADAKKVLIEASGVQLSTLAGTNADEIIADGDGDIVMDDDDGAALLRAQKTLRDLKKGQRP